jgi:hypothetical protein
MRYLVLILCACHTIGPVLAAPAPIGSGETGITVSPQSGRITALRLGSVELPVSGGDFQLIASGRTYTGQDFRVTEVKSQSTGAVVKLSNSAFDITIEYIQTDSGAVRKTLRILPKSTPVPMMNFVLRASSDLTGGCGESGAKSTSFGARCCHWHSQWEHSCIPDEPCFPRSWMFSP